MRPAAQGALKDVLAGLVFIAFGVAFGFGALGYDIGSPTNMGPGYLPLLLGGALVVLGAIVLVKGFVNGDPEGIGPVPWRALGLILGAVLFFGLTVRGLGLVPATFVALLLAASAARGNRLPTALLIATGLTAVCIVVFVVALRLRLPLLGPWLQV